MACILRVDWEGHDDEELAMIRFKKKADVFGIPLFGLWYLAQAWFLSKDAATEQLGPEATAVPLWQLSVRVGLALVASYVLLTDCIGVPQPEKTTPTFAVTKRIGMWVFLTRHCLSLQTWHLVFSVLSPWCPWLCVATHGASLWIAALGSFVSIQWYTLVVRHPDYIEDCELWACRGINKSLIGKITHVPAIFLAAADLCLAKRPSALAASLNLAASFQMCLFYPVFYFTLIWLNFLAVDAWPYSILYSLGTSVQKWAGFVTAQVGVVLALLALNSLWVLPRIGWCWEHPCSQIS